MEGRNKNLPYLFYSESASGLQGLGKITRKMMTKLIHLTNA